MIKNPTAKNWREVHVPKQKETGDEMNDSVGSNRSSLSSGYNRFQFNRSEDKARKNSLFHFTARNREKPHDISVLTLRSDR